MGDGASRAGLGAVRDKIGDVSTGALLDGFAGLDDLGEEDGGLLTEPVRESPLVLGNRW